MVFGYFLFTHRSFGFCLNKVCGFGICLHKYVHRECVCTLSVRYINKTLNFEQIILCSQRKYNILF